jgi:hypothetical protein
MAATIASHGSPIFARPEREDATLEKSPGPAVHGPGLAAEVSKEDHARISNGRSIVYDFCESHADHGEGIDTFLDQETAIVEMIRAALRHDDPTILYLVREETGEVLATGMFRPDGVLLVLRSDGFLTKHRFGVEA